MDGMFPALDPKKCLKTYGKADRPSVKFSEDGKSPVQQDPTPPKTFESKQLTTKDALELLLEGTLKSKVCRYCLQVMPQLSHLDQILEVAGKGTFYKVAIKDMVASFHPFKVADDPNFPDKICENCLDHTISSYLFTQQCERAERALRNCFEDICDKLYKLDPLEKTKKRGRHKLNPNYDKIYVEHEKVMDYAEPMINIVNTTSEVLTQQAPLSKLECLKCCEILPNLGSLLNHMKSHPTTMWYNCRLCGTSFAKQTQLKKHFNAKHNEKSLIMKNPVTYDCKICNVAFEKCHEYLLHIEKHKFKTLMEHLVGKKMNRLCALCFNKGSEMIPLDDTVYLNGICPELHGDKPLRTMLTYIMPDIYLDSHTGKKICEKCLNNALASYIFITQSHFARHRLGTCVTAMLDKLDEYTENNNNICVEIAPNLIMNVLYDINNDEDDELKTEVLEDEFRIKSEDESDSESIKKEPTDEVERKPILNGFKYANEICGEFLTFRKKKTRKQRFTCPVCLKHFISDYFLKRHCQKHTLRNIKCDVCDLKLNSKFQLFEHKKMVHVLNNIDYTTCEICQRCYAANQKLVSHKKRHNNPLCQICCKKFKSQTTYIYHMRKHMKKMSVIMKKNQKICSFCERKCLNANEFLLHVNKVHLKLKPYSCDMCDHTFYTESNLRSHRRLHSVYRKEKCELCDKILYSRKKLVLHIRKHIGEALFCCQICDGTFYSELLLKKHLITRHGGQFCCKLCKTIFVTRKELNCHVNNVHNMV